MARQRTRNPETPHLPPAAQALTVSLRRRLRYTHNPSLTIRRYAARKEVSFALANSGKRTTRVQMGKVVDAEPSPELELWTIMRSFLET